MNQSGLLSWWPNAEQRQIFRCGLRDIFPALVATGAWGFVTGIAMVKSGLTESMATLMTLLVYAGSAQLTSLPLIEASAPVWLIFAAGTVVNLRFIIFGAALFPYFKHYSWPKRLLLGYLTSDIGFVVFMAKYGESRVKGSNEQLWYFIGLIAPGWLGWITCSLLGVYLGGAVPERWSLEFAAILALMAIIIPLVKNRPMIVCCAVAAAIAWLGQSLPLRLGLVAAVLGGVVGGVLAERLARRARGVKA